MYKILMFMLFFAFLIFETANADICFGNKRAFVDNEIRMILCQASESTLNRVKASDKVFFNIKGQYFTLDSHGDTLNYHTCYTAKDQDKKFKVYFTKFPIITIATEQTIVDEPKVHGLFLFVDLNEGIKESNIGIEWRGGMSQNYPKKHFDIEFYEDADMVSERNISFLGMRCDDDWVLDALYNEPLRIRSYVSAKLWLDVGELPYSDIEPDARPGVDNEYVEFFLNGKYMGIFTLMEQVDRKLLRLKESEEGQIRGELFKGAIWGEATNFHSVPPYSNDSINWGGYEVKYPKDIISWHDFVEFNRVVIELDEEEFPEHIGPWFYPENAISYFCLINLIRARDNTGKNIYVGRYDKNMPYFYVPWDMDSNWGLNWDNSHGSVDDIIENKNKLFGQYILCDYENFRWRLGEHWFKLRKGEYSFPKLATRFRAARQLLSDNLIYEREHLAWPEYEYDHSEYSFLKGWILQRLKVMDDYMGQWYTDVEPGPGQEEFNIYPNPANEYISFDTGDIPPMVYFIYDVYGNSVISGTAHSGINTVTISSLPAGIYYYKDENKVRPFIIRR